MVAQVTLICGKDVLSWHGSFLLPGGTASHRTPASQPGMQHRGVLPTKEFRLLLKVQEWDVARAKGWRSLLGMVRLRVCTRLSQPQVLLSLPLLDSLLLSLHHPGMEGLTGDWDEARKGMHVAWEHVSRGSCPSWANGRPQQHLDIWTLTSLSHLLPRLSLPQVPRGIPSSVTDALPPPTPIASPGHPLKPSQLLCFIYYAYSSSPNPISSLSLPYFH